MDENNSEPPSQSVQNAFTILDLPQELLVHVMSHLSFYDRKITRLVCKQWNEASYAPSLVKNDWVNARSVPSLQEWRHLPDHWRCFNLRISEAGYRYKETSVWERFGANIIKIELHHFSSRNPVMRDIFKFCVNLRSLALHGSVALDRGTSFADSTDIFPSRLECLKLCKVINLTDKELTFLTQNAHNLTEFYINDYYFVRGPSRSYYFRKAMMVDPCSDYDFVKVSSVVSLLKRQSTQSTHLDISATDFPDEALIGILSSIGNALKYLKVTIPTGDRSFQAISENCTNLEVISIFRSRPDSEIVTSLFRSLTPRIQVMRDSGLHGKMTCNLLPLYLGEIVGNVVI